MRVFLVSCVKQKASAPAPAKDLYRSDWFTKARAYVEAAGSRWFILSALHGLVHPARIIEPYEHSLHGMTAAERRAWGELVAAQLHAAVPADCEAVFLAGRLYRDPLEAWARGRSSVPMAGLGIGEQKQWLAASVAGDIQRRISISDSKRKTPRN